MHKPSNFNVCAIIPAKGNSIRLPYKNLSKFNGSTLLERCIKSCKGSKFIDIVYVDSDSIEVLKVAKNSKAECIQRDTSSIGHEVPKIEVICNSSIKHIDPKYNVIVVPQCNSPEITSEILDSFIAALYKREACEVIGIDPKTKKQNAAIRVFYRDYLETPKFASHNIAYIETGMLDIHTKEELKELEKIFKDDNKNNS